jgi:hypothetical protein
MMGGVNSGRFVEKWEALDTHYIVTCMTVCF